MDVLIHFKQIPWSMSLLDCDSFLTKLQTICNHISSDFWIIPIMDILILITYALTKTKNYIILKKQSRNRSGVAQRVSGGLGSHISMTFGIWRWWVCQTHAPAAFNPRKYSWYSFSLGAESTPRPWYGRKEYVIEKSSDTTGNRSRDRPTSSAAP